MQHDKLVHMANQIGRNLARGEEEVAVTAIADHLRRFWDPRMRAGILAELERVPGAQPGREEALDPLVRRAVERLR